MRLPLCSGWICVLALVVAGCDPSTPTVPDSPGVSFGRFEGDVVAVWDADGRNMTLREDFAYIDPQGRRWGAPTGAVVNGASIPSIFWTAIGGPFEGKYRNASVVHDVGCDEMRQPWEDVHRMFYEACRCGGVDEAQAKLMYYAVHHFGPRWQPVTENVVEQVVAANGQVVEQEVAVQSVARIDPPPPTPDELEQVKEYIAEDNPEPAAIERFNRDSLHRRPRRGHPSLVPHAKADGVPVRDQRDMVHSPNRPAAHPSVQLRVPDRDGVGQPGQRLPGQWNGAGVPPLGQEEQQRATEIVRQHLEQQTGESRPAEYRVERSRGGYRVLVQFLHQDDSGQMVPYEGGACTARVSRDGRLLEVVSGLAAANAATDAAPPIRRKPAGLPARAIEGSREPSAVADESRLRPR